MNKTFSPLFQVSFFTCCSLLGDFPVTAQSITTDGTLPTPTEVNPTDAGFEINGGTTRDGNLFHSFKDFSVPSGLEAFFNNAPDVVNILNRVTGGNISNINGLIRASGGANLFLINPAGIIFGEGARLDIGGSFYGSTADSILFPDGVEFSATDNQARPLLTINAPIGLNFRDNPQPITNQSTANGLGLQVDTGKNITIVGGNLNFEGGLITAPGGRVELGGLSVAGKIGISNEGSLTFPDGIARADINLTNNAFVNVTSDGGGFININARNLTLSEQSQLIAGIAENSGSPEAQAGDITINAANLFVDNQSQIQANTKGQGNAGNIIINASDFVSLSGESNIKTTVDEIREENSAIGDAGNIEITTRELSLTDNSALSSTSFARGDAGDITINASDRIVLDKSIIFSNLNDLSFGNFDAIGDAGNITVTTSELTLTNESRFIANTSGIGQVGNITIDATDVSLDQMSLILSQIREMGNGEGGIIQITADNISLKEFSLLSTNTGVEATGNAGNIILDADTISITEGAIVDGITENNSNGGDITITARVLEIASGGKVITSTDGGGNAGSINLIISDRLDFDGSEPLLDEPQFDEAILNQLQSQTGLFASTSDNSTGNGGNITIKELRELNLANNAHISVDSQGQGNGGSVSIQAKDISLDNNASISAATASGDGGNINIQSGSLLLRDNSSISAQATGQANGGNVNINSDFIIAFPNQNNDILASAEAGKGGDINIKAEAIFGIQERQQNPFTNDIDASSQFSLDGSVSINTPDVAPFQETTEAPENVVDPDRVVAGVCNATQTAQDILAGTENTLTIKGKGGVPPEPTEPFTADNILINGQSVPAGAEEEKTLQEQYPPIMTDRGPIYPARGIVKNPDGTVFLTAYPTDNIQRVPDNSPNCGV